MAKGEGPKGQRRHRGAGPRGVSRKSSGEVGEQPLPLRYVGLRVFSCVRHHKINSEVLTSQRSVTPVMLEESARTKLPLLAGKRKALPELPTGICLNNYR